MKTLKLIATALDLFYCALTIFTLLRVNLKTGRGRYNAMFFAVMVATILLNMVLINGRCM